MISALEFLHRILVFYVLIVLSAKTHALPLYRFTRFSSHPMNYFPRALGNYTALALVGLTSVFATEVNFAVMISATPQMSPPKITLTWPALPTATEYRISRKLAAEPSFTILTTITTGAATLANHVDDTVAAGVGYEYEVRRRISGDPVLGYGYIASAINLPLVEHRGKIVLLVDETMATPLATGLARLQADLRGDGWTVLRHDVSRTASVTSVKALITTDYQAAPTLVKAVFLFGRIPVAYSGDISPDGHPDHKGAWPADCYYGDMDGEWTDTWVNTVSSSKYGTRNHNIPGDGKFDQNGMPGSGNSRIELMVGRVDLSSLPAFSPLNETQLLQRYLDKDHAWRHASLSVNRRGLIDENSNASEKFATAGFRMFGALFGSANTIQADYTGTLANNAYLASYGDGAGDTSSCAGVVNTNNFATNDYRTVFTFLFGSYYADWDSTNNLLRAALGGPTYTLASTWGSRPYPVYHTLGMGDPIGAGVRMTQNFSGNEFSDIYKPSYTLNYNFDDDIHIALLGDPTLRLHPVKPITNLQPDNSASPSQIALTWSASADTDIVGYHVYRALSLSEPLVRLTGTPITAADPTGSAITSTAFTDATAVEGTSYQYMVRAVKLETSNTGTYYNFSQGLFITVAPVQFNPPAAPTNAQATAVSSSQIDLTWTDNAFDESSYKVERSPDGSAGWTEIAAALGNSTSFSDTGLNTGQIYYYRVRANNIVGVSGYSGTTSAITFNGLQSFRSIYSLAADGSHDLRTPADDGVANLLKFAFNMLAGGGSDPQAAPLSTPNVSVLATDGSGGLPLPGTATGADAGKLQITYIRRKDSSIPGISYIVEFSDDLVAWGINALAIESVTSIDSAIERVTVKDSMVSSDKRFVRVRVEVVPPSGP